jgi:hypothetical protein
MTRQDFVSPVIATSARRGKVSQEPWAVPLRFWQSRHWQWFSAMGSLVVSYRTAPHAHPPV